MLCCQGPNRANLFRRGQPRGRHFSHLEERKISHKNRPHPSNTTSLLESLQHFRVVFLRCFRLRWDRIHLICASKTGSDFSYSTKSADGCFGFGVFGWSVVQENYCFSLTCLIDELLKVLLSNFIEQCLNMYSKLSKAAEIFQSNRPPPPSRSGNPQLARF